MNSVNKIGKLFFSCCVMQIVMGNACWAQQPVFDITRYGATGDGLTMNTAAIQKAIDEAAQRGGGRVLIPTGKFITGTIELKSGVSLFLSAGAILAGSGKISDYQDFQPMSLVIAKDQHDISISGPGIIDGQGRELVQDIYRQLNAGTIADVEWKTKRPSEHSRAFIIYFENCSGVTLKQVTLKNGSSWIQEYSKCRQVNIDSIRVESVAYWNNDGIDIVDCKDVRITNSYVNAADDAICLKSEDRNSQCENIYVANCTLRSSANAFKMGTSSSGGFRNITVNGLTVFDTYRSAIAIEGVDGGVIDQVDIRNITATNTGNAVLIRLAHRNKDSTVSKVSNIYIGNIKVEVPAGKPDKGYPFEGPGLKYPPGFTPDPRNKAESISPWNDSGNDSAAIKYPHNVFPSSIAGLPGYPVENVTLEDIEIIYAGGADKNRAYFPLDSLARITEARADYPEFSMFGELPAWGFFVRHVTGLKMKNITLKCKSDDFRAAMILDDVKKLVLQQVEVPITYSAPVIVLNNVQSPVITHVKTQAGVKRSIRIQNKK